MLTIRLVGLLLRAAASAPLWPLYLLLRLGMARPPTVFSAQRALHCLHRILTADPPPPGLAVSSRIGLVLTVLSRWVTLPLGGLSWFADELLYGRRLRRVAIEAPLFEISAARSGSTQLAHYIEDDPHICAPTFLQGRFPWLWFWKVASVLGRWVSRESIRKRFLSLVPPVFLQRHEMDPFRTDTIEVLYLLTFQLGDVMFSLGPESLKEEMCPARILPVNREVWEHDFLRFLDAVGRKTLLHAMPTADSPRKRLLIKGHCLAAAPALAARYSDARFITVVRSPAKRIQSVVSFWRCFTYVTDSLCGPAPWPWLVDAALDVETTYCAVEMDFYRSAEGPRRCVIRFDDYVRDLEGTLARVYRECLDADVSPHAPREHSSRVRVNYMIDRSLEDLGVDVPALDERLAEYTRWCRGG